jgi:UDP-GlcNAc3NAcA epimerase
VLFRSYFLGVPCLTLRDETEWTETVTAGWNALTGNDPARISELWRTFAPPAAQPPIFGDGTAGERIAQNLEQQPIVFGATGAHA